MEDLAEGKTKLTVSITIDEELRMRLIELGISPSYVLAAALKSAVSKRDQREKNKEKKNAFNAVRRLDPRITEEEFRKSSPRVRKPKQMAMV
jgi:hypothetical protein